MGKRLRWMLGIWIALAFCLAGLTRPGIATTPEDARQSVFCGTWQLAIDDAAAYPENDSADNLLNTNLMPGMTGALIVRPDGSFSWRPSRLSANRWDGHWAEGPDRQSATFSNGPDDADWTATVKSGRRYDAITLVNSGKPDKLQHGRKRHHKP